MTPSVQRALARLVASRSRLVRARAGDGYAVYPNGDLRRRPLGRISAAEVRLLESDGVLRADDGAFVLTDAGRALLRREAAAPDEVYAAQHRAITNRAIIDRDGEVGRARGHDPSGVQRRLEAMKDSEGAPLLSAVELAAANALMADWNASQAGLVRGSDWAAPPLGSARGLSNAQERALAARCDAGRRLGEALDMLASPLRRTVESICLREDGLETLERAEHWPARSGKLALKLGLAQLAQAMASRRRRGVGG
jgi:hypothetical protein